MDMLGKVAEEAVRNAINSVARGIVADESVWVHNDMREVLLERVKAILAEPEVYAALRKKLLETIEGLPKTMNRDHS